MGLYSGIGRTEGLAMTRHRRISTFVLVATTLSSPAALAADPSVNANKPSFGLLAGDFEATLFFSSSFKEKYSSHVGAVVDVTFTPIETLAVGVSVGFFHGSLARIVANEHGQGIIGNKLSTCLADIGRQCDINPTLPDRRQITGVLDAIAIWAPLRMDASFWVPLSIELYGLVGFGVNGTRKIGAVADSGASSRGDYTLTDSDFGAGGFMKGAVANGMVGFGLRAIVLERIIVRGEMRTLFFGDKFDDDFDGTPDPTITTTYLGQLGAGVVF